MQAPALANGFSSDLLMAVLAPFASHWGCWHFLVLRKDTKSTPFFSAGPAPFVLDSSPPLCAWCPFPSAGLFLSSEKAAAASPRVSVPEDAKSGEGVKAKDLTPYFLHFEGLGEIYKLEGSKPAKNTGFHQAIYKSESWYVARVCWFL